MIIETRTLVVEDDDAIRRHLVRALARAARHVDEAKDGIEALELFRENSYPVVVLDLRLPRLDGMEVLRKIRAHDERTQVIVMTGHGNKDDAVEALNLHAHHFFEKPLNIDDVESALRSAYAAYSASSGMQAAEPSKDALLLRIESLYARLGELSSEQANRDSPAYLEILGELRELQAEEARQAQHALRESLGMSPGLADTILELARNELETRK
jgi:DNA-binding NtrC family response regulator